MMTPFSGRSPFERAKDLSIEELRFEGAEFTYDEAPCPLFTNLSLKLPLGQNVWITCAPGAGQSTLLRLISSVVPLTKGHLFLNGQDVMQMSFEEFLPYRLKIGYAFDYGGLFSNRTLFDNLMLPLLYHKICSGHEAEKSVRDLAERFSFTHQLRQRPASVSGGLRKLACILRAFVMMPEMLVMDDPFTALDPESTRKLLSLIEERRAIGELKHVFMTSREEINVKKMQPTLLVIDAGFGAVPRLENGSPADVPVKAA